MRLEVGLAIGLAAAAGLGRMLSGLLFGVQAFDPVTYASTFVILAAVGLVALWVSAWRALRVDAITVLRE